MAASGGAAAAMLRHECDVLLLGATGFLGSHIGAALEADGLRVLRSGVRLQNRKRLEELLDDLRPRLGVVCAAGERGKPNIAWCESHPVETLDANVTGQLSVAAACHKRGLHCTLLGSGAVYAAKPDKSGKPFDEKDEPTARGSGVYVDLRCVLEGLLSRYGFDNTLVLRVLYPLSSDMDPRGLLGKIARFKSAHDVATSVTVIEDLNPFISTLIKSRAVGPLNFTNAGTLSFRQTVDLIDSLRLPEWEKPSLVDAPAAGSQGARSTCQLDCSRLSSLVGRPIPDATTSVQKIIAKLSALASPVPPGWPSSQASASTRTPEAKRLRSTETSASGVSFVVVGNIIDAPSLGQIRGLSERRMLGVSSAGRILTACTYSSEALDKLRSGGARVLFLSKEQFLVPGFVDTHIHAPQFRFMGTGIDRPLMSEDGFLFKYAFPAETGMSDEARARRTYGAVVDMTLAHGTTTTLYFGSLQRSACQVLVEEAEKKGQRAFVGKVCMDRMSPDGYVETAEQNISETAAFIEWTLSRKSLVKPAITPRFVPTCSPELLSGLGRLAMKHPSVVIQSHMSESLDEVAFSKELHPGTTDAQIFDSHGLLRAPCVMAHCVQLQDGEEELLRKRGTAIGHCPLSNFYFAGGALPAKKLTERGVTVALGTDVAGGYSPSMLNSMRNAVLAAKALQFPAMGGDKEDDMSHLDALYLATTAGAKALGLAEEVGAFDVGKAFDAVLLEANHNVPTVEDEAIRDILERILTLGDDRNVRFVWVDGRAVKGDPLADAVS
eukprot:TRINITY_DN50029_c0_g1_i1.p1 TRINITY_DN50029_c0_g1~~TRINITY_DN50029_c0_g1_i1.p1  ORF type:complete len:799 (+),score=172.00 TRINITY_DN50029_c0_g1_i1:62-2398(+)